MQRGLRWAFSSVVTISAALSIYVCTLWVRSSRALPGQEDRFGVYFRALGCRYSIRVLGGEFVLFRPPMLPAGAQTAHTPGGETADSLAGKLSNDQLTWFVAKLPLTAAALSWAHSRWNGPVYPSIAEEPSDNDWPLDHRYGPGVTITPSFQTRSSAVELMQGRPVPCVDFGFDPYVNPKLFSDAEVIGSLLRGLEDPGKFAVAHILLAQAFGHNTRQWEDPSAPGAPCVQTIDGLRTELRFADTEPDSSESGTPQPDQRPRILGPDRTDMDGLRKDLRLTNPRRETDYMGHERPCAAAFDPAQLPAIRDRWHRRLDVAIVSIPCWGVLIVTLAMLTGAIVFTIGRKIAARLRRSRGLCRICGYDLRATTERCPECGAVSDNTVAT